MRICMLLQNYRPVTEGGAERQCRLVAAAMAAAGHEVTVVTRWRSLRHRRREKDGGVQIYRFGILSPLVGPATRLRTIMAGTPGITVAGSSCGQTGDAQRRRRRLFCKPHWLAPLSWLQWWERLLFAAGARMFFRGRRGVFDVIHVHESHWIAALGVMCAQVAAAAVIVKEADMPALQPLGRGVPFRLSWEKLRRRASYIALTPESRQELIRAGIERERVFIVPNGVAIPRSTTRVGEARGVLMVANLYQGAAHKGFDTLFDAWLLVCRAIPEVRLVVAGAGDPAPWRDYCRCRGIESRVVFTGFLKDLSAVYQTAAVFVLPSRHEGLSNALLEAQSRGIPAVVSDIPGNRAVVSDNETGLIVPADDCAALAHALLRLLEDPSLRIKFGAAARSRIKARFSIGKITEALLQCYARTVKNNA